MPAIRHILSVSVGLLPRCRAPIASLLVVAGVLTAGPGCDEFAQKTACEGNFDCLSGQCEGGVCVPPFGGASNDAGVPGDSCVGDGRLGPPDAPWNQDIRTAPVDVGSGAFVQYLADNHSTGTRMQIDFSQHVLEATDERSTPFVPNEDWYEPDCDGGGVMLPVGGAVEGADSYVCPSADDNCHLLVVDPSRCELIEVWRANVDEDVLYGGCQARWDLEQTYVQGRGLQCASADAAGMPIAPLLARPDNVSQGTVRHALRITLPAELIQAARFVEPAMHTSSVTAGDAQTLPIGARLRLKSDIETPANAPAALGVLYDTLKVYGAIIVGTGSVTFTFASDRDASASWPSQDVDPHVLKSLQWTDFDVLDLGPLIPFTGDCIRTD